MATGNGGAPKDGAETFERNLRRKYLRFLGWSNHEVNAVVCGSPVAAAYSFKGKNMAKRKSGTTKYAIYLRCSTDDQSQGDFTTIDTQREINTRFVQEHCGVLVAEHVDEGKSGTNLKRPGWESLLADARDGKFDVVCCTYMSRLARGDAYYVAEYLLKENGVRVELVQEKFTPDLAGHVNKQMTILMDGMYPKMVSQWTRTKMEQMVAQGFFCGGTIPYGFCTEIVDGYNNGRGDKEPPKRLVLDEDAAAIVQGAYSLFLDRTSMAEVRRYLKSVSNRAWTNNTVKYLLTNEIYIGNYSFGDWRKEDAHEAIIDKDTWAAVQSIINKSSAKRVREPKTDDYTYYLRGLVKCPHCGCSYTNGMAKGGAVRYYQCLHDTKHITDCPVGRINANALHASVLRELKRAAEHWTVMHQIISQSGGWQNADEAKKKLRGQLAKKLQFKAVQIGNITNAISQGGSLDSLLATLRKFEQEKVEIEQQLNQVDDEIAASTFQRPTAQQVQVVWSRLIDLWEEASEEERAEIMQAIVQEVVVEEKTRVSLVLTSIPETHEVKFAINKEMGAGRGFEPLTFGL